MAVTVQLFAGGSLVSLLTGIPLLIVMPILALISLTYTFISGLEASVITDFLQLGMIFAIGAFIIPMALNTGGTITGAAVLQVSEATSFSISNIAKDLLDPGVAFSFGIVTSIGLIAGAISDQQYWQRSFAIKKKQLKKAFVFGALLFGIVPIALSSLGFIAAEKGFTVPEGIDISMIGVETIAQLLPTSALFLFVIMLLSGLASTLDSGLSAASSLWVTDIADPKDDKKAIREARKAMIGITLLGLLVAIATIYVPGFGLKHLWWIFNTIAACVMVPTVLSLYYKKLSEKGVVYGVLTSFVIGIPLFIYSNIINNAVYIVASSLFIVAISTLFCFIFKKKNAEIQAQIS
jgi:Na+/proline symporter